MANKILFAHHHEPSLEEVKQYFLEKGAPPSEATDFYRLYEVRRWTGKRGGFIKRWKTSAFRWISTICSANG